MVLISYGGGIVAGLVVSWLTIQVRRRLQDPAQHALLALLAPLSAYLLAEAVEASGVLAAVVSGLWVSRVSPRLFPPAVRRHVRTIMSFISALLNAALFVLVGLEVVSAVGNLGGDGLAAGLITAAAVSTAVIGARFGWLFTSRTSSGYWTAAPVSAGCASERVRGPSWQPRVSAARCRWRWPSPCRRPSARASPSRTAT